MPWRNLDFILSRNLFLNHALCKYWSIYEKLLMGIIYSWKNERIKILYILSLNSPFFFLFAQDTHLHLRLCTEVILSSMHSGRFPSTCSARTVTQRSRPLWRMRQGPWPGWFASSWYCLGRCHLCCIARMSKLISPQEFDFISMSNIKKGSSDNQNALFKFTFFYGCTLQTISMYFAIWTCFWGLLSTDYIWKRELSIMIHFDIFNLFKLYNLFFLLLLPRLIFLFQYKTAIGPITGILANLII